MTPEERFESIERKLDYVAAETSHLLEVGRLHSQQLAESRRLMDETWRQIAENTRQMAENRQVIADNTRQIGENRQLIADNTRQIAENGRHIAQLAGVTGALASSQSNLWDAFARLAEAQERGGERLDAVIHRVRGRFPDLFS